MAPRAASRDEPRFWGRLLIALLLLSMLILAGLLFSLRLRLPSQIPLGLHSALLSDYSADPRGTRVAPVSLDVITDTISDQASTATPAPGSAATVIGGLQTPVPTVTPPPGATAIPITSLPPTGAATDIPGLPPTAIGPTNTPVVIGTPTGTQAPATSAPTATVRATRTSIAPTSTLPPTDTRPPPPTDTPPPPPTDTLPPPPSDTPCAYPPCGGGGGYP
jgi:hypothetical protein